MCRWLCVSSNCSVSSTGCWAVDVFFSPPTSTLTLVTGDVRCELFLVITGNK